MAEINLLKQSAVKTDYGSALPSILIKVFAFFLLALIGYYGWLFVSSRSLAAKTVDLEKKILAERQEAMGMKERDEFLTRQLQLQSYGKIIDNHVYWSKIIPILATSTLKSASYNSIKSSPDGSLFMTVTVPTVEDLDKFLQVFDLPQYYQYFHNLRINSYNKIQTPEGTAIGFDVKLDYNPALIKYSPPQ